MATERSEDVPNPFEEANARSLDILGCADCVVLGVAGVVLCAEHTPSAALMEARN